MTPLERDAYTEKIHNANQHDNPYGAVQYTLANIALSEARSMIMQAQEPSAETISGITYRFESAAIANENSDALLEKRALMIGAFIKPLIWSDLINTDGLTSAGAKNVGKVLELKKSNDTLAGIARDSLTNFIKLVAKRHPTELNEREYKQYGHLRGFLQEATIVLLGNRTNTAKMFILPTLEFENALQHNRRNRADGTLYDNRKIDIASRKHYYQAKSGEANGSDSYDIPVIDGIIIGNRRGSAGWGTRPSYTTLRTLLDEREGSKLQPDVSSNLDRIWSSVRNKIMLPPKKTLLIPTPSQIRR